MQLAASIEMLTVARRFFMGAPRIGSLAALLDRTLMGRALAVTSTWTLVCAQPLHSPLLHWPPNGAFADAPGDQEEPHSSGCAEVGVLT